MAVTLRPKIKPRERIMVMGVQGTGKTKCYLDVMRAVTDATFYVIDNDSSFERLLVTEYEDVAERGQYELYECMPDEWRGYLEHMDRWTREAGADDWLVIDSTSPTWQAAQSYMADAMYDEDITETMLRLRKESKTLKDYQRSVTDSMNWPLINKEYAKLYAAMMRWPGHLFLTAELDKIGDRDEREVKDMFGVYGVKPRGNKRIGHTPATIMLLSRTRDDEFMMTTIKDRGRTRVDEVEYEDFAEEYLKAIAGWSRVKVDGKGEG